MNVSYCQTTLMLDKEKSNIKYSAKHVLHAWEGINNDVSGVAVYNESISKIALAAKVIDFDSGNSGRDSHSLEVLEALKFPNIKFYSEDINSEGNAIIFNGEIEFHGEKNPINVFASIDDDDKQIRNYGKVPICYNVGLGKTFAEILDLARKNIAINPILRLIFLILIKKYIIIVIAKGI